MIQRKKENVVGSKPIFKTKRNFDEKVQMFIGILLVEGYI